MFTTLIECEQLRSAVTAASWVVVDCRFDMANPAAGHAAYLDSHIPGAIYAHLDDDLSAPKLPGRGRHPLPSPEGMRGVFGRMGIDAGRQVVVYDASGGTFAARLWWMLRYLSHDAVCVLNGGFPAWLAAGLPVARGEQKRPPAQFHGQPRTDRVVPVEDVPGQPRLVDSRDPARYRGEQELIDPVAGHIPGAVNHFCRNNLDDKGCFRDRASLRALLQPVFGSTPAQATTFYCGSGVTACHNILAAVHAGFPQPRLYAGSWSEWCSDRSRPVAAGDA